tara:strand:- start:164 stop:373 length:210 start_codon:yes stop_codon:yes gene_type:complete
LSELIVRRNLIQHVLDVATGLADDAATSPTSALTGHGAGVGCGHEADSGDDGGVGGVWDDWLFQYFSRE